MGAGEPGGRGEGGVVSRAITLRRLAAERIERNAMADLERARAELNRVIYDDLAAPPDLFARVRELAGPLATRLTNWQHACAVLKETR